MRRVPCSYVLVRFGAKQRLHDGSGWLGWTADGLPDPGFAPRLDLALKALSIGRGRLAAEVQVDKSLVTRWLNGTMRPSPHNLERISRVIAQHCAGFSMLDWERDMAGLASRLGVAAMALAQPAVAASPVFTAAPPPPPSGAIMDLPFGLVEAAEKETARRITAYAGRWRITRLSASGKLAYVVEHMLIRRRGNGLWLEHFAGGHVLAGWLLVLRNRLYSMLADETDDSFAFYLLNGVSGPRTERMDGLLTSVGSERYADPFSMVVVLDRVGELSGGLDGDDDDATWAATVSAGLGAVEPDAVDPAVRAALIPDVGPAASRSGTGDAILRIPNERSLARGTLQAHAS